MLSLCDCLYFDVLICARVTFSLGSHKIPANFKSQFKLIYYKCPTFKIKIYLNINIVNILHTHIYISDFMIKNHKTCKKNLVETCQEQLLKFSANQNTSILVKESSWAISLPTLYSPMFRVGFLLA